MSDEGWGDAWQERKGLQVRISMACDLFWRACLGATEEQIEAIRTAVVGAGGLAPESECKCPICLEEFVPGSILRCMDCTHTFHKHCLDKWLSMKATCPICQRPVSDKL